MKKITILLFATFLLSGCSKDEANQTTVEVTVQDNSGLKSNFTVYQISDQKYNLYGTDPFFKDQQSVTASNGVATFKIADLDFATGGQRTYYFFANYTLTGSTTLKVKSFGTTLSKGEKKTGTLTLN